MKLPLILLACLIATGCVTGGYNPSYRFNELEVHNLTGAKMEDVSIRVVGSEKTVQCEQVAFNATCQERFNNRRYPQQGIELSWIHEDGNRRTETFNPQIPATFHWTFPLRIVMEVDPDGEVNPFYEQEEPSGIFDS